MENLVPEKLEYRFGEVTVEVPPLSIKQMIELSRFLSKKVLELTRTIEAEKLQQMSFGELLDELLLSEENIYSLLDLITGKDKAFYSKNGKLAVALRLIKEVFIREEIGEVFTEKLQITQMMAKIMLGQ